MTFPRKLGRASVLGIALALWNMVLLGLLVPALHGFSGVGVSGWDLLFVALLGLVAAPLALVEWGLRSNTCSVPRQVGLALLLFALAALGLVAAFAQVTYTSELLRLGSVDAALMALGHSVDDMIAMGAETRVLLVAFGAPFGFCALGRLRRLALTWQALGAVMGSVVLSLVSLIGFHGWPQVRWLIGTPWCSPLVGTFVMMQPVILSIVLPLFGRLLDVDPRGDQPA